MGFLATGVSVCRTVEIGALFALVVFPPLAAGATSLWAFYISVWLSALGLSALLLRRITEGRSPLPAANLILPMGLLAALALVSLFVSIYPYATWMALLRLLSYLAVMFIAADIARHRRRTRKLIWVIMGTSALLVLIGLIKYSGGPVPSFWMHDVPSQAGFLTSTFYNHNHLSGYLEMAIPLLLCVLIFAQPNRKGLWYLVLMLLLVGVVLAMSRGGWLALMVALVFCALCIWLNKQWSWLRLVITGTLGAFMVLMVFMASTPAIERLEIKEDLAEPSIQDRALIWKATYKLIEERPVLGWGLGAYPWAFPEVRPLGLSGRVREAHNDYLQAVAAMGLIVLLPILWGAGATIHRGMKTYINTRSSFKEGVSLGAMGAIVAMAVHSLVDFNIQITSNGLLFFIMVGLAVGVSRQNHVRPVVFEEPEDSENSSLGKIIISPAQAQKRKPLFVSLGGGMALFLLVIGFVLGQMTVADVDAVRASGKLAAGQPQRALPLFKSAIDLSPDTPYYYYGFSKSSLAILPKLKSREDIQFHLNSADWSTRSALKLNPLEGNLWYQLAEIIWMAQTFQGFKQPGPAVLDQLKKALELDPNNGKFLMAMVRYHAARGEVEKCLPYIGSLAAANPVAYKSLSHLNVWKDVLRNAFKQGLMAALDNPNPLVWRLARSSLVHFAEQDGDFKTAAEYTGQLVERRGKRADKELLLNYGTLLMKSGQDKKAMKLFMRALASSVNMAAELEDVLWRFKQANRLDLYEELVKRQTEASPILTHWRGMELGKIYLQQGRWLDAEAQFSKALKSEGDAAAHAGLAEAYLGMKKWDAAELHAAKALLRETKSDWNHFLLARALLAQEKYEAALSAIDGAISLVRGWRAYYFDLRGRIHAGQKRYHEAITDWELALAIKPSNVDYMIQLSNAYNHLGMKAKAREYYRRANKR